MYSSLSCPAWLRPKNEVTNLNDHNGISKNIYYSGRGNSVPPDSHPSGSSDVTLFGHRIFADIIRSRSGDEIVLDLRRDLNQITDVLTGRGEDS